MEIIKYSDIPRPAQEATPADKRGLVFIYNSFQVHAGGFSFEFICRGNGIDDIVFTPTWTTEITLDPADPITLRMVFDIGMAELPSYWKAFCIRNVVVKCGVLRSEEIVFWKKLYFRGLGEFFYRNNISLVIDDFMNITTAAVSARDGDNTFDNGNAVNDIDSTDRVLIPVGGGKDSIVTLELLKNTRGFCYVINPQKHTRGCVELSGKRGIYFKRVIDSTLIELNRLGALNGHTPISSVIAFSAALAAYTLRLGYVVLSNESSANDVYVPGSDINHQYSKSIEFERDFRAYMTRSYVHARHIPEYFSFLRPLSELKIAELFARYPQYTDVFMSCNLGTKTERWCGKCAKCLYTFVILQPFIGKDVLIRLIGSDMPNEPRFAPMLAALLDPALDKPFECVGTREEVAAALEMARNCSKNVPCPFNEYDEDNFLPPVFAEILKEVL